MRKIAKLNEQLHATEDRLDPQQAAAARALVVGQPLLVPLTLTVTKVAAGRSHMLALTDHFEVFAWGDNQALQLGFSDHDRRPVWVPRMVHSLIGARVVEIACGAQHTCVITSSGRLMSWGHGKHGRLGHGDELEQGRPRVVDGLLGLRCIKVAAGRDFNFVLTEDEKGQRRGWSWGRGADGRLGSGASFDVHIPEACEAPEKL